MDTRKIRRWALAAILGLGIAAFVILAFVPTPLRVEAARAQRGPLRVTVDEEGETRAQDRFVLAAPVPGRLLRIELDDGDAVSKNQVVAMLDPQPLSQRERQEVVARVEATEAARRAADARVAHALADHDQAKRDLERAERLERSGIISTQVLDQAKNAEVTSAQEMEAARHSAQAAAYEVSVARAGLVAIEAESGSQRQFIQLRSPVSGRVLRVVEKSERVVSAGTPILILGDPKLLEVVVDVLSTDAVKVQPGAPAFLEGWGGDHPIQARVRLVEPYGFTKISALGIEEKRVNVIADFVDPPGPLGDGYRVEARIIVWSAENVLKVPSSAVFRRGQGWGVFGIDNNRARAREVTIGHRGATEVEILRGVDEGTLVILHPSNQIQEGSRVRAD